MTAYSKEEIKRLRRCRRNGISISSDERIYLHHLDAIKGRYIKFVLEIVAMIILAVLSFCVLNVVGDVARGYHAYGGECLIPLGAFLIVWMVRMCNEDKER